MTTESPLRHQPTASNMEPVLDEDQRAYEALFGLVAEWHAAPTDLDTPDPLPDDDELYAALFGDA